MSNNPERQPGVEGGSVDYGQQLTAITNKINALSDENTENDNQARESLQNLLDDEFLNNLDSYLQNNETLRANLQNTLIDFLDNYKGNREDAAYKSLTKLANKLGLKENGGKWSKESSKSPDPSPEKPTLGFTGKLEGIKTGEEGKKQKGSEGLYNGLKRDAPAEGENLDDNKNLYKTIQEINTQLSSVGELLGDSKLQGDEWLKKVKEGLELVQTVINYTTTENVKILQKFISDNLTGEEKKAFDRASKRGNEFDGKFGQGTLKGTNIILRKTGEYITSMKQYLEALNTKENKEKLDQITIKDNPTIVKVENTDNIDYGQLLNIPDGVSVEFESSDAEKLKTPGPQDITLKVKLGNEEKIFQIRVNVTEPTSEPEADNGNTEHEPTETKPLDFKADGKTQHQYLMMHNTQSLAQNIGLPGATFYSTIAFEGEQPGDNEQWGTMEPPTSKEYECFMTISNRPNEIYKVKVDVNGNICPVATQYNRTIPGIENEVLLRNNRSCTNYLQAKAGNYGTIEWDEKRQNYRILSHGKGLTVEPMTIAGDWVSKDLTTCLRLMNLTNYLRSGVTGLDGNDPDLKLRDGKLLVKTNGGKKPWIDIPLSNFGLENTDTDDLSRFVRYNNHERWEDNWNNKGPNRKYSRV